MMITEETKRYIRSQIGDVAYNAFQEMFNTPTDQTAADTFMQTLLDQKSGNLDCLLAAMLTAVKEQIGGAASILGRIKIGPIELENVISDIDNKIKGYNRACSAAGSESSGIAQSAFSGALSTPGGW